ncbi:putative disease resistance protein RGA3 [Tasmannia lanceolata]|uniref:putative disease resistance protein RGA3 n=1 Tax=Tasmannia lanceolata TaxID=3420 RepID=UPI004062B021
MAEMVQMFVSSVLGALFGNLTESAIQEMKSIWGVGVEEEVEKLERKVKLIQGVIEDAEEKQFHSKAVGSWLRELKNIAYDANDILDDVASEAQSSKRQKVGAVRYISSIFQYERGIAREIREISGRLDVIVKEGHDLHLEIRRDGGRGSQIEQERRETSSLVDESDVIGRQVDKDKIIQLLVSDDDDKLYSVIPIVGMGGVGKTTLAQFVYNDHRVKTHFELRVWACVSDDFNVLRITNALVESASGSNCDLSNLDAAQRCLEKKLNRQKFLIVLDDVWGENQIHTHWDTLRAPFGVGAKGSKIIITTRDEWVARMLGAIPSHHLKVLPDTDCWELFTRRAFAGGISNAFPELEEIGRQIVKKCKGLPLAVKTVGGILSYKRTVSEWERILTSEIWKDDDNKILPALRLSYCHLPANQKHCFAYCAKFPKDHWFDKDVLVRQWMATGFIQIKGSTLLEDIGGEIFDDLLLKSFFQCIHQSVFLKTSIYVMHDLMHDLAESVSGDECCRMEDGMPRSIPEMARHLSWTDVKEGSMSLEALSKFKRLRTLQLTTPSSIDNQILNDALMELRCLRVLDLNGSAIDKLPDSIGHLKHLRYLDLSGTKIERLPESVTNLCNLQILVLKSCWNLKGLPKGITNLVNLRNIFVEWVPLLGIGKLTSLQTLPHFKVCEESGCQIGELKNLSNIKGRLEISGLEHVQNIEEAKEANLKDKKYLNELSLKWHRDDSSQDGRNNDDGVLEGLQPHANLKKLHIKSYGGVSFPSWMSHHSNLTLLTTLDISAFLNLKSLPKWMQSLLPCLKELKIKDCPQLHSLFPDDENNDHGLPTTLNNLEISSCPNLKSLPKGMQSLTSLTNFGITSCPQLFSLFPDDNNNDYGLPTTLVTLFIWGCENLKSLPNGMQNLTSLNDLHIMFCPEISSLPEDGLPTTLTRLYINGCPKLKESFQKNNRQDWPKKQHIPHLFVT